MQVIKIIFYIGVAYIALSGIWECIVLKIKINHLDELRERLKEGK